MSSPASLERRQRDDHLGAAERGAARRRRWRRRAPGSTFSSRQRLQRRSAPSICAGVRGRPRRGSAPTSCAPTLLPPSPSQPKRRAGLLGDPVRRALERRAPAGCCAAALPSSTALRSPLEQRRGDRLGLRRSASPAAGAATPLAVRDRARRCRPAPAASALGAAAMLGRHRHQPVVAQRVQAHHLGALLAPPGAGAARTADGPCAGTSRRRARAAARTATRSACRASATRRRRAAKSAWRSAGVDVLAAEAAHQLGEQVQLLDRADAARPARRCSARRARPMICVRPRDDVVERRRSSRPSSTRRPA